MSLKPTSSQNPAIEFGVKSQLAKLLATENIRIEHRPGIPTAAFDVKNRLLILPVWQNISEDLYDMLILHETAHAIDTPSDGWINEIKRIAKKHHSNSIHAKLAEDSIKDFLNVIEDARIDKRQKRRYPGGRRNYVKGLAELHERDFFGLKASGKDVNSFAFIDRANIYFKGGTSMGIRFDAKEQGYIKRMEDAETFEEVVQLTDEIYQYARSNNQMMEFKGKISIILKDGNGDGAGDDINIDDLKDFDDVEIVDERSSGGSGDQDGEDKGNSKDADASDGSQEGTKPSSGEAGNKSSPGKANPYAHQVKDGYDHNIYAPSDYIPKVETEVAAAEKMKEIVLSTDDPYVYVNTPKFRLNNIVEDFSVVIPQMESAVAWVGNSARARHLSYLQKWKNDERKSISFMVKEFEMRKAADTHSKITIAKTGILDTNKLHSYRYNDDVFRRNAIVPEGKNHGFVMFLDWSGSMRDNLKHTMKQLFSLVLFCKNVQIPFDVYLFRDPCGRDVNLHDQFIAEPGALKFRSFKLRNILSSRMNTQMLNKAMDLLWLACYNYFDSDQMTGTPLNQAILVAHEIVNEFRRKNRVQIVNTIILSDGGSDSCLGICNDPGYAKARYFLRDHVTGKIYPIDDHPRNGHRAITYTFTKMLKDRTDSNVVGFYLFDGNYNSLSYHVPTTELNKPETKKLWLDEGFVTSVTAGYDEYYILNPQKFTEKKPVLNITAGTSAANAFTQFNNKKRVSRVLLRNFIIRISNFKKEKEIHNRT
jgi:hypothetical protein